MMNQGAPVLLALENDVLIVDGTPAPHFSPHWRSAIIAGNRSIPFSVS